MEIAFLVWAAGITISCIAADVRISLLSKRLDDRPQQSQDSRNASKPTDNDPEGG